MKTKDKLKFILICIGNVIPVVLIFVGIWWCLTKIKHRREEKEKRNQDELFLELTASENFRDVHELEHNGVKGNNLLVFSFATIMAATEDFSIQDKLGQGGFGPVYKAFGEGFYNDTLKPFYKSDLIPEDIVVGNTFVNIV